MRITVYQSDGSVSNIDDVRHIKIELVSRWPFVLKLKKAWHIHGYKEEKEK